MITLILAMFLIMVGCGVLIGLTLLAYFINALFIRKR